jgi:hypothetical protein
VRIISRAISVGIKNEMTFKIVHVIKAIYGGFVTSSKKIVVLFYKDPLYLQVVRTNNTTLQIT